MEKCPCEFGNKRRNYTNGGASLECGGVYRNLKTRGDQTEFELQIISPHDRDGGVAAGDADR